MDQLCILLFVLFSWTNRPGCYVDALAANLASSDSGRSFT